MALYKRGNVWWSRVYQGGRIFRRSMGVSDFGDAMEAEDDFKDEIKSGLVSELKGSPSGDIGAAAELLVAADLITNHGCQVFRNISPNGPYDLVVCHGEGTVLLSVQVKSNRSHYEGTADIFAVLDLDGSVSYWSDKARWLPCRPKKPVQ